MEISGSWRFQKYGISTKEAEETSRISPRERSWVLQLVMVEQGIPSLWEFFGSSSTLSASNAARHGNIRFNICSTEF
jgi:hypothetical protein